VIKLVWSPQSRRDIERLQIFLRDDADQHFPKIAESIVWAGKLLAENPSLGPKHGKTDQRKWTVRGMPYILFYRTNGPELRILRVRHAKENWRTK
jgi:toxin ParE1/3/4